MVPRSSHCDHEPAIDGPTYQRCEALMMRSTRNRSGAISVLPIATADISRLNDAEESMHAMTSDLLTRIESLEVELARLKTLIADRQRKEKPHGR